MTAAVAAADQLLAEWSPADLVGTVAALRRLIPAGLRSAEDWSSAMAVWCRYAAAEMTGRVGQLDGGDLLAVEYQGHADTPTRSVVQLVCTYAGLAPDGGLHMLHGAVAAMASAGDDSLCRAVVSLLDLCAALRAGTAVVTRVTPAGVTR